MSRCRKLPKWTAARVQASRAVAFLEAHLSDTAKRLATVAADESFQDVSDVLRSLPGADAAGLDKPGTAAGPSPSKKRKPSAGKKVRQAVLPGRVAARNLSIVRVLTGAFLEARVMLSLERAARCAVW